ncbi:peptidase [Clostridium tetani]|uniref:GDSL-type esterase/lipase family protein n=1 Tax=Clostridium tetani TaxID=1513 RepID=UPI000D229F50|nr:GDSL-type esterase/lipase family protein [Clostridium tetani]AVP55106.1 peptidase [Clostridium tetani]RXI52575.1 peptidase [Clostridium tetani]RXI56813.1 peptidase [Clostridium tetani]RXI62718.1 peptidase [Clostridium tetani]RXI63238.1 peptidase [Clostridium tetani]
MKIVCIGDSITFGYGVKNTENWVSILNNNIKIDFINKGLNGDTSSGMLFRSYEDIIKLNPDAVFIMGGTNDFLMNYDWNKTLENIIYLSREIINYNIKVYIGIQPPTNPSIAKTFWDPFVDYEKVNIKINNYRKNIIEFCENEDLDFFDFFTLFNDHKDEWDSLYVDGIHPSAKGHKLISEKIHL